MSWPWNPGQRSLKVIGIDTDRSAACGVLLTFHSNHGPISYSCRDKRRFQSKIAKLSHNRVFCAPAEGVPLLSSNWVPALGVKNRMIGLPGRERGLTISSAVWIQYTNVTDRQTDGRTPGDSKRPRLRIASRDNEVSCVRLSLAADGGWQSVT